jgi:hypothetical protein
MPENQFDVAASAANNEFEKMKKDLDAETLAKIQSWWKAHYMRAGHKRLGRIIAGIFRPAV